MVSIAGESGSGKTTLAYQLMGNMIALPYCKSSLWIQASEHFSLKRFSIMFEGYPEKLNYLKKNVFVVPARGTFRSYDEQCNFVGKISNNETILPLDLKCIVIDNISHHLRREISNTLDIKARVSILNDFFNSQLVPLFLFCRKNLICLMLIHEFTYDPGLNKNVPFFYKLYERTKSLEIMLTKQFNSSVREMKLSGANLNRSYRYTLNDDGFRFSENY